MSINAQKPPNLTQSFLKSILLYCPVTGKFTWIKQVRSNLTSIDAGSKNRRGYIKITINGRRYAAHRLAFLYMTGKFPKNQVDHRDRVRSNNIWKNLRQSTNSQNQMNSQRINKGSGYRGVTKRHKSHTYFVRIKKDGIYHYGGNFSCRHEAALKYNGLAIIHHGEFAQLNEITQ